MIRLSEPRRPATGAVLPPAFPCPLRQKHHCESTGLHTKSTHQRVDGVVADYIIIMSCVYVSSAGARGRGLFCARNVSAGSALPLGRTHGAVLQPGCQASACAACGCFVGERGVRRLPNLPPALTCACGVKYCSEECRDAHSVTGHKLLCPKSEDGFECHTLDEPQRGERFGSFLPLAIHVAAGIVAEQAAAARLTPIECLPPRTSSWAAAPRVACGWRRLD